MYYNDNILYYAEFTANIINESDDFDHETKKMFLYAFGIPLGIIAIGTGIYYSLFKFFNKKEVKMVTDIIHSVMTDEEISEIKSILENDDKYNLYKNKYLALMKDTKNEKINRKIYGPYFYSHYKKNLAIIHGEYNLDKLHYLMQQRIDEILPKPLAKKLRQTERLLTSKGYNFVYSNF